MTKHPAPPETLDLSAEQVAHLNQLDREEPVVVKRPALVQRAIDNISKRREIVLARHEKDGKELAGLVKALLDLGWEGE
jgi:hypothetical protein